MPLDTSWMDAIPAAAPTAAMQMAGTAPASTPDGAPPASASPPSFPMVAPHAAPDGSGGMTNLSDADYFAFTHGQPPQTAPAPAPTGVIPAPGAAAAAKTGASWMDAIPAAAPTAAMQMLGQSQSQSPPSAPHQDTLLGGIGATLNGIAEGAVGSEPINYAAAALGTPFRMAESDEGPAPAFRAQLAQEQANDQRARQQYPAESFVGNVGGALMGGAKLAPFLGYKAPAAAGIIPKIGGAASYLGKNAAYGGAMAALNGQNPVEGAALGAGFAGATPALGAAVRAPLAMARRFAPIVSGAARDASVGQTLARSGVTPGSIQSSPVGPLDLAQATNNAAIAAKVRYAQGLPQSAPLAQNLRSQQAQAVRDQLSTIAPSQTQADASDSLLGNIRDARETTKQHEQMLWNAPALKSTPVQTQWIKNSVAQAVAGLAPGLKLGVTGPIKQALDMLGSMPAQANVSDLNSVRTALRLAGKPSESNPWASPVSQRLQDAFLNAMDRTLSTASVSPDVKEAYSAARAFTRERAGAFGTQAMRQVLAKNPAREYITDATKGAGKFFDFARGGHEGPESIAKLSEFMGKIKSEAGSSLSSSLKESARSYIASALFKAAKLSDDHAFSPNAMVKFLKDNRAWMQMSGLFNKDQLDVVSKVMDYGEMLGRTENLRVARNSATNEKGETAKTFIDEILSPWTKRIIRTLGGVAGWHEGSIGGAFVGGFGAHAATEAVERAEGLMRETMAFSLFNPQDVKGLLMKATPGNARFLSPATRKFIAGALRVGAENLAAQNIPSSLPGEPLARHKPAAGGALVPHGA